MKISKSRLSEISTPVGEDFHKMRQKRRRERELVSVSTMIAAKIVSAMRAQNIKKNALAERLGVSAASISRYISGKANFELKTLLAIQNELNITLIATEKEDNHFGQTQEFDLNPLQISIKDFKQAPYKVVAQPKTASETKQFTIFNLPINQMDYYGEQ